MAAVPRMVHELPLDDRFKQHCGKLFIAFLLFRDAPELPLHRSVQRRLDRHPAGLHLLMALQRDGIQHVQRLPRRAVPDEPERRADASADRTDADADRLYRHSTPNPTLLIPGVIRRAQRGGTGREGGYTAVTR